MQAKNRLALLVDPELREVTEGLNEEEISELAGELERLANELRAHIGAGQTEQSTAVVRVRKKSTVKRGAWKPFFRFKLMSFYDKSYRNMARCLGISHRQLFNHVLLRWSKEVEHIIGLDVVNASKLTPRECRAIRQRVALSQDASWKGGNSDNN